MPFQWLHSRAVGLVLGALTTGVVVVLLTSGTLEPLNDLGLDLHFRFAGGIAADSRVVMVDIDDSSIAAVGQWPWPRERHADLVRTLHELGAHTVVMDVIFADPTAPRLRDAPPPGDESVASLSTHGEPLDRSLIYDDRRLADAISAAGNVLLAVNLLEAGDETADDRLGSAARGAALDYLVRDPDGTFVGFLREAAPEAPIDAITPIRQELARTFRWAHAVPWVTARCGSPPVDPVSPPAPVEALQPPLDLLACAAKGFGLTSFDRNPSRGVVRRLRMFQWVGDCALPQLGLAAATGVLEVDVGRASVVGGEVALGTVSGRVSFPIEDDGLTLLNWHVPPSGRWQDSFVHLPAARLLKVADLRNSLDQNDRRYAIALGELVEARFADTPGEFDAYARLVNERLALREELANDDNASSRLGELDKGISTIEDEAVVWLKHAWGEVSGREPRNESERADFRRIADLYRQFGEGHKRREVDQTNAGLSDDVESLLAELRPAVEAKICFVGYTATAVADLVATPVYTTMPGVMAHANVANMFLQDDIPAAASRPANLLLLVLAGALVTVASNSRGWRFGLAALLLIVIATASLGLGLFWTRSYHLATLPAILATVSPWAVVTVYRQATEERLRRRLQRALTQYTSAAIAARIAGRVRQSDLAPRAAVVTCFFSDLSDFTRISEQLGPDRTRDILNPYLETVSRILVRHGAIVNKFVGDGVFSFFNAPIRPCPDHARAACQAALEVQAAVEGLNAEIPESNPIPVPSTAGPLTLPSPPEGERGTDRETSELEILRIAQNDSKDNEPSGCAGGTVLSGKAVRNNRGHPIPDAQPSATEPSRPSTRDPKEDRLLRVRIGITTGEVFVGDYGSADKLDYTCIGDTVNVGSRLEEANKAFGTTILTDDATRKAAGEGLSFRSLGRVLLRGKENVVTIHELHGRTADEDRQV